MTKDRRTRKARGNNNGFKPYEPYKSHVRGSTRSNRSMKTIHNNASLAKQIRNILEETHRNSEIMRIAGNAANAFGTQGESTLPPRANKAERNAAIHDRLMRELIHLETKARLTNKDEKRIENIKYALKDYVSELNLGGGARRTRRHRL